MLQFQLDEVFCKFVKMFFNEVPVHAVFSFFI